MLVLAKDANATVAFLLELGVYVAAGGWGFTAGRRRATRLLLGLGGPLVLVVLWALFGAPSAVHPLHGVPRVGFELLWYGAGTAALAAWWRAAPAAAFAAVCVLSGVLARIWGQQG
ncbi:YrdB family protein [Kitasatospora sp. LaBMicrA B282]|uniref:YrdB family protein n=1 Tax=Kitasatospora sp. LaBMicrA B282 TaxID=3420949 RepID=UPI003D0A8D31